jgi:hypothetical protein
VWTAFGELSFLPTGASGRNLAAPPVRKGSDGSMKRRKPKPFRASKEVKRLARLRVGSPPLEKTHKSRKSKLPKHRKREAEKEIEG